MSSLDSQQENLKQLGVRLYQRGEAEDRALAILWDELSANGELSLLLSRTAHSLSSFLHLFRPPNMLVYTWDGTQMESIYWLEPISTAQHAVFFSSWFHAQVRGTKRQMRLACAVYDMVFAMGNKVILGVTKQEPLLSLHGKLGYVIMDPIPFLFDESHAYLMYMTQPMFEASRIKLLETKLKERSNANRQPANA